MSTSSGIPAFDLATRTTSGAAACIVAMTGMSSSGPFPQLPPIASAPHAASASTASSGDTPIIVWPRVSKVIVATSAIPGAAWRTPSMAALISVEIGHRLDPDEVHAAGDERRGLLAEDVDGLVVGERPERLDDLAGRSDVAGHERVAARRVDLGAEQDGRGAVELVDAVTVPAEAQPGPVATERVGQQDLRPGLDVARAGCAG